MAPHAAEYVSFEDRCQIPWTRRASPWMFATILVMATSGFFMTYSGPRSAVAHYASTAPFRVRADYPTVQKLTTNRPDSLSKVQGFQDPSQLGRRDTFFMAGGLGSLFGLGGGQRDDIKRGVVIPGYQGQPVTIPNGIPTSAVTNALRMYTFPTEWPYIASDFYRLDENDDGNFYDAPRFVTHIDDGAISAIRTFYDTVFSQAPQNEYAVLDTCSSWVSHYPKNLKAKRVAITGMNEAELRRNSQATDYSVKDLNKDPTLPYEDGTFDFVTNVVSIDYVNKPRQVVSEAHRVMKPGGLAIFSFSNRCFFTKAISMWIRDMNDGPGHCRIVANYFRFSPEGGWKDISCVDISANPGWSDPMWVVTAVKA